jgi:hypothetical protein
MTIIYLLVYEDGSECSETSAYKIQTLGNYPEENIQQGTNIFTNEFVNMEWSSWLVFTDFVNDISLLAGKDKISF